MSAPVRVVKAAPEQQQAFAQAAGVSPLPGYTPAELWGAYTPPQYLVKRLLGPSEVTVLFGQSGHFKSAIAVDLALSVATGRRFHGINSRKAGVLYVAGEGHGGMRKRLRAWMIANDMNAASEQPALYVTQAPADLMGNPMQLRITAEHAATALGVDLGLVVLDTLASNFGFGDENHASDMALAIGSARQAAPSAAVLLIHHTGHASNGAEARERGSYALAALADYRLCASYDNVSQRVEVRFLKVKDDERPEPLAFSWRRVNLDWRDADAEELSSVALDRVQWEGEAAARDSLGKNQDLALRVLQRLYALRQRHEAQQGGDLEEAGVHISAWRAEARKAHLPDNRFKEAMDGLVEHGCVATSGQIARPIAAKRRHSE